MPLQETVWAYPLMKSYLRKYVALFTLSCLYFVLLFNITTFFIHLQVTVSIEFFHNLDKGRCKNLRLLDMFFKNVFRAYN